MSLWFSKDTEAEVSFPTSLPSGCHNKMVNEVNMLNSSGSIRISSDIPSTRIASAFLIIFALVIILAPQFANNREELGPVVVGGLLLLGSGILCGGIAVGNASKRIDVYFCRKDNSLLIVRKGWFSSRLETETYNNNDIKGLEIETCRDSDGDSMYRLMLKAKTGKLVPVSVSISSREVIVEKKAVLEDAILNGGAGLSRMMEDAEKKRKVPKSVVLITLAVVAAPFLAGLAAQYAGFSRLELAAGYPDVNTCARVQSLVQATLQDGEKILWVGQPEFGREAALKQWIMIPFSIIWTLFSLFWTYLACCSARQNKSPLAYLMVVFGLPFVFVGFGLLSIPYFSHQQDLQTVYVLTDRGALRVSNGKAHRLTDYKGPAFGPIEVTSYKPDRADLMFVTDTSEGNKHPYGGFYGVQAGAAALEILEKYSGQKSVRK
jgi:hypothetical protein